MLRQQLDVRQSQQAALHHALILQAGVSDACLFGAVCDMKQVVSNEVSGLDMDKVDYEIRDVLMAGLELEQDCRQLIPLVTQHCKVSRDMSGRWLCCLYHRCADPPHDPKTSAVCAALLASISHASAYPWPPEHQQFSPAGFRTVLAPWVAGQLQVCSQGPVCHCYVENPGAGRPYLL